MQQAVLHHFPEAEVVYRFTNRSMGMKFTWPCIQAIIKAVNSEYSDKVIASRILTRLQIWRACHFNLMRGNG